MSGDNLRNLLDSLSETSIYVIEEKSHRLLYCNQRCRKTGRGRAVLGAKCHEIWPELCGNCPVRAMGSGNSSCQTAHCGRCEQHFIVGAFTSPTVRFGR